MFYPTTCVGLRYGPVLNQTLRAGFLGSMLHHDYQFIRRLLVLSEFATYVSAAGLTLHSFNELFRQFAHASLLRHRWNS